MSGQQGKWCITTEVIDETVAGWYATQAEAINAYAGEVASVLLKGRLVIVRLHAPDGSVMAEWGRS